MPDYSVKGQRSAIRVEANRAEALTAADSRREHKLDTEGSGEEKANLVVSAIEKLLESFATAALGLELESRIEDLSMLPRQSSCCGASESGHFARVAWHTERGIATLRVVYDEAQSLRVRAHVVKIAWWIGSVHHEGWWHCYPKFPCDWIKGIGRP